MSSSVFKAVVEIRGINPFVSVSASRLERLKPGWRKPLPVLVRINDQPKNAWRTNLMPAGDGAFYLYLNGGMRAETAVSVGSVVNVELAFDASYRNGPQHPMPSWFSRALRENEKAGKNWAALTPSRKKEVLRYFAQLKAPEARARNVSKALHVLSGHTGRFMARTWTNGS
ncbi:MAG: YdeI/OmpD-associated family protein [Acidobacteriaceae bacterium]